MSEDWSNKHCLTPFSQYSKLIDLQQGKEEEELTNGNDSRRVVRDHQELMNPRQCWGLCRWTFQAHHPRPLQGAKTTPVAPRKLCKET
jgi:hypothetical protein